MQKEHKTTIGFPLRSIGLDLDVCVPQWMRDNFAKGLYPTLEERTAFAESACDYVEESIKQQDAALLERHQLGVIISFSFVNTDLRDTFRIRFPEAEWFLVDTSEDEASERIRRREGHFYNGKVEPATEEEVKLKPLGDNDDWNFAPVTFPHTVLDGTQTIKHNAARVAQGLMEVARQRR